MTTTDEQGTARPLGLNLLTALYLFFFLVTFSTMGSPFPFLGRIYEGGAAQVLVLADSLATLYLFLGLVKRQYATWILLIAYNLFEICNTAVNLWLLDHALVERAAGHPVDAEAMAVNSVAAALALLLLTQYIYRHRSFFINRTRYLF